MVRWTDFMSQMFFVCPLQIAMNALAANVSVFGYELNDPDFPPFLSDFANVHGADLLYLWGQDNGPIHELFDCDYPKSPSCILRNRMRQ